MSEAVRGPMTLGKTPVLTQGLVPERLEGAAEGSVGRRQSGLERCKKDIGHRNPHR